MRALEPPRTLQLESCTVDLDRRVVRRGPAETGLTQHEASLLGYLAARPGEVVRREELLTEVWGYRPGVASRAVDSAVVRLRGKIERDPADPRHLRSSYGHGYALELPSGAAPAASEGPARTISAPGQTNLTRAPDALVGRAAELAELTALLGRGPGLVTLLGPGGVGKTRAAREVGVRLIEALAGGVWFVALAEVAEAGPLVRAVAEALGVELGRAAGAREAADQLAAALASRGPCLLILDNLEQLGPSAGPAIDELLARAPALRVLATSRSPLTLARERPFPLAPLPDDDAVALFELRARAARPGFRVGPSNQEAVRALVGRLDGLPLAVELAAAWSDVLPPDRLLRRLASAPTLPARRPGARRHDSIDKMLDWSWDMLSAELRAVFAGAAIFRGGFDLEAADAVLGDGEPVIAELEALRQRSLLRYEHAPGRPDEPRFSLLQVVQGYASARLAESGLQDRFARAHREWYLALGERLAAAVQGPEPERLHALALDLDNLLAVARRCAGLQPELSARAALAADPAMLRRGPFSERLRTLEDAIVQARRAEDPALLCQVLLARADAARLLGKLEAANVDLLEAGALATSLEDDALTGAVELAQALVAYERGRFDEAVDRAGRARTCFQRAGDRWGQADALRVIGQSELGRGEGARGEAATREALALLGGRDARREALLLRNLGMIAVSRGDSLLGRAHLQAALERDQALSNGWGELLTLPNLGNAFFDLGEFAKADRVYAEGLARARTLGYRRAVGALLVNAGALARVVGDPERSARLLDEAIAIAAEFGHGRAMAYALVNLAVLEHEQGQGEPALARYAEARALLAEGADPTQLAWCLCCATLLHLERGELGAAAETSAALGPLRGAVHARVRPALALTEAALSFARGGAEAEARAAIAAHGDPEKGRVEARFIASRLAGLLAGGRGA